MHEYIYAINSPDADKLEDVVTTIRINESELRKHLATAQIKPWSNLNDLDCEGNYVGGYLGNEVSIPLTADITLSVYHMVEYSHIEGKPSTVELNYDAPDLHMIETDPVDVRYIIIEDDGNEIVEAEAQREHICWLVQDCRPEIMQISIDALGKDKYEYVGVITGDYDYEIPRTDELDIRLAGDLKATIDTRDWDDQSTPRYWEIWRIYCSTDKQYVAQIVECSIYDDDDTVYHAKITDNIRDAIKYIRSSAQNWD